MCLVLTLCRLLLLWAHVCSVEDTCPVDESDSPESHYDPRLVQWFDVLNNALKHDQYDSLPVDQFNINPNENHTPRLVPNAVFSAVEPQSISNPKLVSISKQTFHDTMNLSFPPQLESQIVDILVKIVSGDMEVIHDLLPNVQPYAHCYCGHQFGYFSGQLGDGRAVSFGEYHGSNGQIMEWQLKGSGKTPFSRRGDGRAVLRSSIREYLMSEYMHSVGIPSSRAAMLVVSESDTIPRDPFYDGQVAPEPVAIVLRVSPNWIRFGSFELHIAKDGRYGPNWKESIHSEDRITHQLLDYVIQYHYTAVWEQYTAPKVYEEWWKELVLRNVELLVKWQCIGFVHGVLNTDNLSILGVGIDYGPFGMMEHFEADFVPNFSDNEGRYAYNQQKDIFRWNLEILASSLDSVLSLEMSRGYLDRHFESLYEEQYGEIMRQKLGLLHMENHEELRALGDSLFGALEKSVCDMTNSFRALNMISIHGEGACTLEMGHCSLELMEDEDKMNEFRAREKEQVIAYLVTQCVTPSHYQSLQKRKKMIRTHFVDTEIDKMGEMGNKESITSMTKERKRNHDIAVWSEFMDRYRVFVDSEWTRYLKSRHDSVETMTEAVRKMNVERTRVMNAVNPKYILRNHLLQNAIEKAHKGDYSEIERLREMIADPFTETESFQGVYDQPVGEQSCHSFATCNLLSCSS